MAKKFNVYEIKKGDLIRVFKADCDVFVGRVTEIRAVDSDPDYIFFENGIPMAVSVLEKNAEVISIDELIEMFALAHQCHIDINKLLKETLNKVTGLMKEPEHLSSFERMIGTADGLKEY